MNRCLGKRPATKDSRDLKLARYLGPRRRVFPALPTPPPEFGHDVLFPAGSWGMLANDQLGDCVFAGGAHETMVWAREGGRAVAFSDDSVISDYSAVTGYTPSDPDSDQGTLVRDAMSYRRQVGLLDASGERHRIGAYVGLELGNAEQLLAAMWLFGAVGIGFSVPRYALDQIDGGEPWDIATSGTRIVGGHYVPLVGSRGGYLWCVTWGQIQPMTERFFQRYCDEAWVMLSTEMLSGAGRTMESFDLGQLQADLGQFKAV